MKRRIALAAAVAAVTLGVAVPASASVTAPRAGSFANCPPGTGVNYGFNSYIRRIIENTPSGPLNNIEAYEDFRIVCQPISGSVTIELQYRSGVLNPIWYEQGDPARFNFPTMHAGFTLAVGPTLCQGRKTSWRLAIFSSGIAGDGSKWGPTTSWDPRLGGSSGTYFNCG